MTVLIAGAGGILLLLGVLYAVTKEFIYSAAFRIYSAMLYTPPILYLITRGLKKGENRLYKKALWLCGIAMFLDLVVVQGIRFILSGGVSTVLFSPACAPVCAMVVLFCGDKEDNRIEKKVALWVGIPWLILSLYFEVLSFIQL